MQCQLCLVEKETVPVKAKQATIFGPKGTVFNVCKECLEACHKVYVDKEFYAKKGGAG